MYEQKFELVNLKGKILRSTRIGDGTCIEFELADDSLYSLECPGGRSEEGCCYKLIGGVGLIVGTPFWPPRSQLAQTTSKRRLNSVSSTNSVPSTVRSR